MQGTAREDIDTMMLTVRHMEKRMLDRVEELSTQVDELDAAAGSARQGEAGDRPARTAQSQTAASRSQRSTQSQDTT